MFKVKEDVLDLRFNAQKVKTVEAMQGVSLMSELHKNRGLLSFQLLEGLFSVSLYNQTQEQNVNGQKAIDIFNELLNENGYADMNAVIVSKLQEDMGFLFR